MQKQLLVVMNPSAHDWEARDRWPQIEPALQRHGTVTLLKTDPDNAVTINAVAQHVSKGFDRVVAIGGDGTVQLTCAGIMQAGVQTLPEFAVIPFGTANNVAKSLGLPLDDLRGMAKVAAGPRLRGLDVGLLTATGPAGTRRITWVNCVGVGMDADIVVARSRHRKLGSYTSYAVALAERAVEQRSLDAALSLDGNDERHRVFNIVVSNVPLYAGELSMPGSRMDDGVLDVYLFNRNEYSSKVLSFALKKADFLKLGVGSLADEITSNQRERHARSVTIRLAFPREVQVDGDALGEAQELTLSVQAQLSTACT